MVSTVAFYLFLLKGANQKANAINLHKNTTRKIKKKSRQLYNGKTRTMTVGQFMGQANNSRTDGRTDGQ